MESGDGLSRGAGGINGVCVNSSLFLFVYIFFFFLSHQNSIKKIYTQIVASFKQGIPVIASPDIGLSSQQDMWHDYPSKYLANSTSAPTLTPSLSLEWVRAHFPYFPGEGSR